MMIKIKGGPEQAIEKAVELLESDNLKDRGANIR